MARNGQEKTSRVLYRVRALFLLAILLPLGGVAWLSYQQVESSLIEQSYNRSFDAARFHGTQILDQLMLAELSLKKKSIPLLGEPVESVSKHFVADFLILGPNNEVIESLGDVLPQNVPELPPYTQAQKDRSFVMVGGDSGEVYIARREGQPNEAAYREYFARLNKAAVFGDEIDQLLRAELCVFKGDAMLYCTSELSEQLGALSQALKNENANGRLLFTTAENDVFYGSARDLFLPSHFNSESWNVVVVESYDTVFAPIREFRWFFPALVLLTILVLTFLALNQTRRHLGPLSRLQRHARRVGAGDFETRLDLNTNNEFEALASSLNDMAGQLGGQFNFLEALTEIDSAILDSTDLPSLCEKVLTALPKILSAESAAIASVVEGSSAEVSLHVVPDFNMEQIDVSEKSIDFERFKSALTPEKAASIEEIDSLLSGQGDVAVYPLTFEGETIGALWLRMPIAQAMEWQQAERLHALQERLIVALSSLERQKKLYVQAHFDSLTGLPNRILFVDRLNQYIAQAKRQNKKVAVVYADLDKFKVVNDTLGHEMGDQVLKDAATRFGMLVRGSDTVARLSGDEFVLALPGVTQELDVASVLKGLVKEFSQPFIAQEQEFHLNISMGVAFYPADGDDANDIIKHADIAMYRVKSDPSKSFLFFEDEMNEELNERTTLSRELQAAVRSGALNLAYQPKVDPQTHRIQSAEALIRWNHPVHGFISPAKFIPIAEEAGLVPEIGKFALEEACRQFALWRSKGLPIAQVAVNVSPRQVQYTDLVSIVQKALEKSQLPPSCLELEITEDLLIEDYEKTQSVLSELQALGVGIALDDFGTGYSSLGHINQLPFDTLKIDKCFVDKIGTSESSDAIVLSIVALGKTLGKKLVAEGVEDAGQLRFLAETGCELIQGYYFSKPLAAEELTDLLSLNQPLPYMDAAV
ncbi:MAG: putative bifunctional diguanylate cyclase/phosphodiesterase [Halioglobus sp.]